MKVLESSLEAAVNNAQRDGVGFANDVAPDLLQELRQIAEADPSRYWQEVGYSHDFPPALVALRGTLLQATRRTDEASNLDYAHIIHRPGKIAWHRDKSKSQSPSVEYVKGRFRAGFNLYGNVNLWFENPDGEQHFCPLEPGDLYVLDLAINPLHASQPSDEASESMLASKVLLLTDVVSNRT